MRGASTSLPHRRGRRADDARRVFACLPLSDAEPTKPGEPVGWLNLAQVGEFGGVHRKACFGLFFSAKHSVRDSLTALTEGEELWR